MLRIRSSELFSKANSWGKCGFFNHQLVERERERELFADRICITAGHQIVQISVCMQHKD